MFWVYGPGAGEITVIGLEPHPEDAKSRGYDRVLLSELPPLNDPPHVTNPLSKPTPKKRR
jgi:hypothetical protein